MDSFSSQVSRKYDTMMRKTSFSSVLSTTDEEYKTAEKKICSIVTTNNDEDNESLFLHSPISHKTSQLSFRLDSPTMMRSDGLINDQLLKQIERLECDLSDTSQKLIQSDSMISDLNHSNSSLKSKEKDYEHQHKNDKKEIKELRFLVKDTNSGSISQIDNITVELRKEKHATREERKKCQILQIKIKDLHRSNSSHKDDIHQLEVKLQNEITVRQQLEDNYTLLQAQYDQDMKQKIYEWRNTIETAKNDYETRMNLLVSQNVKMRQSLHIAVQENEKIKVLGDNKLTLSQNEYNAKLLSLQEKYEASFLSLRSQLSSEKNRSNNLYERASEELSIAHRTIEKKDTQLAATANEIRKVAVREAMAIQKLKNVESRILSIETSFREMQSSHNSMVTSLDQKTSELSHIKRTLERKKLEIDSLRAEFDPLLKKYIDSMTNLKLDHSRKDKERKKNINKMGESLHRKQKEIDSLKDALNERDELFEIMDRKLANMVFASTADALSNMK